MISTENKGAGVRLVLLAALLWGTTGTAQALAPTGATPLTVGALRLAIGGAVLLLAAGLQGGLGTLRGVPLLPAGLAAACIAGYQLSFFGAVGRTGVAVGTMVAIGSSPIAAGILDMLVRKERPGRRWMLSTVLAVAGCALLSSGGGAITAEPLGIILALTAGASYAGYTLALKGLLPERSPDAVVALVFALGACLLLPLLAGADLGWAAGGRGFLVILHLGVVTTALSYRLFARGLGTVPVSSAVTLSLAEPLTAACLGVAVLGEHVSAVSAAGMALIFGGLLLLATGFRTVAEKASV
ncbi:MAG TPA: DMT family transporter [Verrucomicrobiae bacterium]|nr:DMT family transporter [Verrucomicrobiae bacterium]